MSSSDIKRYDVFMSDNVVYSKCVLRGHERGFLSVCTIRGQNITINDRFIVKLIENTDPVVQVAVDEPVDGVVGKIGG